MSLQPSPIPPVPDQTAAVARAAFRRPPLAVRLRDEFGALYSDADFAALFPARGQPALRPWRLAFVTVLQFLEGLSDRQAADAVRARIDWKYALSLELTDAGFDYSVLSEFRTRLVAGGQDALLLDRLLDRLTARGLVRARGRQRTDSTHVLTAVRALNRLELVAEALRAALNAVAAAAPDWLGAVAPPEWHRRYDRRVEDTRLPSSAAARERYGREVGADGDALLGALDAPTAPPRLRDLPAVAVLRRVWARHYDADARYRRKRATAWTGYMVHVSETCDAGAPRLVTHVDTTPATAHEATRLDAIHAALTAKGLPPAEHLADAAYISAALLVRSADAYGVALVGPPRPDPGWQRRAGGYAADAFRIEWDRERAVCPQGHASARWKRYASAHRDDYVKVGFAPADCRACPARAGCVRSPTGARQLLLHPPAQHTALAAARARMASLGGRRAYALRAGVEGTLSQAVRAFGLRRARYRGLPKTRLQHAATAALNLARLDAWLAERPLAPTRVSRFARLAA